MRKMYIIKSVVFSLILAISIGYIVITPHPDEAIYTLSKYGSRSSEVRKIQERLKDWGYYDGWIDGIYGDSTVKAVKKFQKKHGLTPDGIAGPSTLQKIGLPTGSSSSSGKTNRDGDLYLLARIISAEARGEPYKGQVAVGAVVLNRVKSPSFPNTLSGVVYQPGAFTAIVDGQFNEPISDSAYRAAADAMNGVDPTNGCIYYYNPAKTSNKWMHSRPTITVIGNHRFAM